MKKTFVFLCIMSLFILQGCIESAETRLKRIIDTFEQTYHVSDNHITIDTYTFSPEARILEVSIDNYLLDNHFVRRHAFGSSDVDLSITLEFSYRHARHTKTYHATIKSLEEAVFNETKSLVFANIASEYEVASNEVDIYLFDEGIPYVNLEDFIHMLQGAIETDTFRFDAIEELLTIEYGEEERYTMEMNFTNNTVFVNTFDFFSAMSSETETEFGKGLSVVDYVEYESSGLMMPLGTYGIDLVRHQDKYLVPIHLANLFFSGSMYDVYYNGDELIGFDTYQLMDDPTVKNRLRDSSKNSHSMSEKLRYFCFNFLAFSMDYFYGLKTFEEVNTYYEALSDTFYMVFGTDRNYYLDILKFAFNRDDLHTSYVMSGYFEYRFNPQVTIDHIKPRTLNYYETYWSVQNYCEALPSFEMDLNSKTLFLHVNGFDADTPENLIQIFGEVDMEAIDQVVLNLTCNGGGVIGAMLRTLGMLSANDIPLHSMTPIDDYRLTQFIQTEEVALDKPIFVWVSPLTYSAANLMTSMVKEMGVASIVGQTTSGGACAIQTLITPDGTILLISSQNGLANQDYSLIENGIEPDVWMQNPFSKSELLSIINQQT